MLVSRSFKKNLAGGLAGLDANRKISDITRPITSELILQGKALDSANDPTVWDGYGSCGLFGRFLKLESGSGVAGYSRCQVPVQVLPSDKFAEVTCRITDFVKGVGGVNRAVVGFQTGWAEYKYSEQACFFYSSTTDHWYMGTNSNNMQLSSMPLKREVQAGDVLTTRLYSTDGVNINKVCYYVNGNIQYECNITPLNYYPGIGVYNDAAVSSPISLSLDYYSCSLR